MEFVTSTTSGNGSWLKPQEFSGAKAFLLEVKNYRADVPNPFQEGVTRNIATADVTVFLNAGQLDGSEDPISLPDCGITQTVLAKDLQPLIGKAAIFRLDKAGKAWVWRAVDPAIAEQVIAYAEGKSAPADDDMPDFTAGAPF